MTPGKADHGITEETRHMRGLDLQAVYTVLLRSYLRRRQLTGDKDQPTQAAPPLP